MDIFVLKALVDELRQHLWGAVVSKVFQMSPDDLLLRLWRHQDLRLLLSTQAAGPRLHLTTARFRNPLQPPRFAAFLRAHLTQVRLCDITVQPYERVVSFCWERPGEPVPALRLLHTLRYRGQAVLRRVNGRCRRQSRCMPVVQRFKANMSATQCRVHFPISIR